MFALYSAVNVHRPLVATLTAGMLLAAGLMPARAQVPPIPAISAPEAIVVDGWTGRVLYAKNDTVPRDPASTVKIMTMLVLLRHHVRLHRMVTVSELAATYGGSTAGLWAGERMSVWNLMHGMMLPSGNDAAIALSETLSPTIAGFAALMNRLGHRLGLRHTRYLSPNGFDLPGQVTTAYDEAILARIAMDNPVFARIVRTRTWRVRAPDGTIVHVWRNLNDLLWESRAVDGVKTGTTPGAGACLVSSARKHGRWVIAVNLGSTEALRFQDGARLLNYGFLLASSLPGAA